MKRFLERLFSPWGYGWDILMLLVEFVVLLIGVVVILR